MKIFEGKVRCYVPSPSTETWKQVKIYQGPPRPPQVLYAHGRCDGHGHQNLLGNQEAKSIFLLNRLILSNDVETNPGPSFNLVSYNARGLGEYAKLKRILNFVHKTKKKDFNVTFLQETHLNLNLFFGFTTHHHK
jgi:hypothetical protein